MPKTKIKLQVRLPDYPAKNSTGAGRPGMRWRRAIYQAIKTAADAQGVALYEGDQLECDVVLYLSPHRLNVNDIDNLLKHIFDALQGRLGGPKGGTQRWALIPNDYQIRLVTIEKHEWSKNRRSSLTVRDYVKSSRVRLATPPIRD
jgi:Holliday junction resolvase RusA-like endonuclease